MATDTLKDCSIMLANAGQLRPRWCSRCGLGPCEGKYILLPEAARQELVRPSIGRTLQPRAELLTKLAEIAQDAANGLPVDTAVSDPEVQLWLLGMKKLQLIK